MTETDIILYAVSGALALAGFALASLRWLRVAQREHYIAPWVGVLARLWLRVRPINLALAIVILVLSLVAVAPRLATMLGGGVPAELRWAVIPALVLLLVFPLGLGIRGRSSALAWTARLKRLTVAWVVLFLLVAALLVLVLGSSGLAFALILAPAIMDLALAVMKPIEKRLSRRFLISARKRLAQVNPRIVAITGSYGKTSTKGYVAQVLGTSFSTVASPASFNNLMGLSRAVNERVVPGTEIFVAEMGIYGTGEIRELSQSFPPDIAAITTIGEAHLARMGSREVIFQAKSEITERAKTVVLPIDDPLLFGLAEKCRAEGKRVVTVSTQPSLAPDGGPAADVTVDAEAGIVTVRHADAPVETAPVTIPGVGHAVNLAVAVGIAVALDLPLSAIAPRLASLPDAAHRAEVQHAASGVVVIDDTYNSNPVGAARALEGAAMLAASRDGELVVVTPGMVELGSVQRDRNRAFAAQVAAAGGHLFAIGRTNRAALVFGAAEGRHPVRVFDRREGAVAAALDQAGERGVILYENDLPDHYP